MRALLNLVLLAGLVGVTVLAWDKPLRERASEIPVLGQYISQHSADGASPRWQAPIAIRPQQVSSGSNGVWMWDPNHKTPLDRPAYNQTHSFTKHVYYVDNNGAKYWIDAQGQRHYEP